MPDLSTLFEFLGGAAARHVMTLRRGDLEICKTRVMREGRGFPWDKQIAVHRETDGYLEIKALDLPKDATDS